MEAARIRTTDDSIETAPAIRPVAPVVNAAPPVEEVRPQNDAAAYHAPNAMLNLLDSNRKIQFDKDRNAARQSFFQPINQNTAFFHKLEEKLGHLVMKGYYESEVLEAYDFEFVKGLYDHAYAK